MEGVEGVGGGEAGGEGLELEHGLERAAEVVEGALEAVVAEPAAEDGGAGPGLEGWAGGMHVEGAEEGGLSIRGPFDSRHVLAPFLV